MGRPSITETVSGEVIKDGQTVSELRTAGLNETESIAGLDAPIEKETENVALADTALGGGAASQIENAPKPGGINSTQGTEIAQASPIRERTNRSSTINAIKAIGLGLAQAYANGMNAFDGDNKKRRDSTVEIEVPMGPKLMPVFTSHDPEARYPDGTIGALLVGMPMPDWYPGLNGRRLQRILQSPWDTTGDFEENMRLLRHISTHKPYTWDENRVVPNIKVKERVSLKFYRSTSFLGVDYPPGHHEVDVSRVFREVEYSDPRVVHSAEEVELHLRNAASAGTVANDAWIFLDGLGIPRVDLQEHILAGLPLEEKNPKKSRLLAVLRADHVRRANLIAEFITILYGRGGIYRDEIEFDENTRRSVDHLTGGKLYGYITSFEYWIRNSAMHFAFVSAQKTLGTRNASRPIDGHAGAWVALRHPFVYDEPGVYGLEYRAIHAGIHAAAPLYRVVLDAIQEAFTADPSPDEIDRIGRWLSNHGWREFASAWYAGGALGAEQYGWLENGPNASQESRQLAKRIVDFHQNGHAEVQMLLYDWSQDPLLLGRPAARQRIRNEKVRALVRLGSIETGSPERMESQLVGIMRDFIKRSGLFEDVLASFGLTVGQFGRIVPASGKAPPAFAQTGT